MYKYDSSIANRILRQVSETHGIPVEEIIGKRRYTSIMAARADAYARLRDLGWSYPHIGYVMNRDHTTILLVLKSRGYQDIANRKRVVIE